MIIKILSSPFRKSRDFFLQQHCILCGAQSDTCLLCSSCEAALPLHSRLTCPQCALKTTDGNKCGKCIVTPPAYDHTIAAFTYQAPIDALIGQLKYGHKLAVAKYFGEILSQLTKGADANCIVPVPSHLSRLQERGYNQANEIARHIAQELKQPLLNQALLKQRSTQPQATLHFTARAESNKNAFSCTENMKGQRILLVDDVMTTGHTVQECAKALKNAGADSIYIAVVARTLPKALSQVFRAGVQQ